MEELIMVLLLIVLFVGTFLIHGQRVTWGLAAMVGSVVLVWILYWLWNFWQEICSVPSTIEKTGQKVNYESN